MYVGGFFLNSQQAVDEAVDTLMLGGHTSISGFLWIGEEIFAEPAVIWDLSGFSIIDSVGFIHIENTDSLETLNGLENINAFDNSTLTIRNNRDLISIASLSNAAFPRMGSSIDSNVRIKDNPKLTSLEGLNQLTEVGGQLRINENELLEDISALSNLGYVGDLMSLSELAGTSLDGLENIVDGEFSFFLFKCPNLTDISALSNWDTLNDCHIFDMPVVSDLSPLNGITIGFQNGNDAEYGGVSVSRSPLVANIPVFNYFDNRLHRFVLEDLPSLQISGLTISIERVTRCTIDNIAVDSFAFPGLLWCSQMKIRNNPNLVRYEMTALLGSTGDLNDPRGPTFEIDNNAVLRSIIGAPDLHGAGLEITNNPELKLIDGFTNLQNGFLRIAHNEHIDLITGFENLEHLLSASFSFGRIDSIQDFNTVKKITDLLFLYQCEGLSKLPNFDSLRVIGSLILSNSEITELSAETFPMLDTVHTNFSLYELPFIDSIVLPPALRYLRSVESSTSCLTLINLPQLKYIGGLDAIEYVNSSIELKGLSNLEEAPGVCQVIRLEEAFLGEVLLEDNVDEFNEIDLVVEHCDLLSSSTETTTTGLEVEVYPNPVSDQLYFKVGQEDIERIEVLDLQGQKLGNYINSGEEYLDFSPFSAGIYFVRFINDQGKFSTSKVVKMDSN